MKRNSLTLKLFIKILQIQLKSNYSGNLLKGKGFLSSFPLENNKQSLVKIDNLLEKSFISFSCSEPTNLTTKLKIDKQQVTTRQKKIQIAVKLVIIIRLCNIIRKRLVGLY